jgi:hypothetical protein
MRYRKLDQNGDMTFGHGTGNFWHDVPDAVGQSVQTRLMLFAGEWFLNITEGTPWGGFPLNDQVVLQGRILAEHTQLSRDAAIRDRIISTTGVATLVEYYSTIDAETRAFRVNAVIDTTYGGNIVRLTIAAVPGAQPNVQIKVAPTINVTRPPPPFLRQLPAR